MGATSESSSSGGSRAPGLRSLFSPASSASGDRRSVMQVTLEKDAQRIRCYGSGSETAARRFCRNPGMAGTSMR